LERCKTIPEKQAECLVFRNQSYVWQPVTITGYEDEKFLTKEGHKVSRLSLLFNFIDR